MKILVDENMPYAEQLFRQLGEVKAVSGRPLPIDELNDSDALMVRSITKVNESLLSGKPVKFVGTATAGFDHVDIAWLEQQQIGFHQRQVVMLLLLLSMFSALMMFAEQDGFQLTDKVVGIVGVGNVGGRLATRLRALGVAVLLCDPPRADNGDNEEFHSLETLLEKADILTFHTPLNKSGPYKSYHLINESNLKELPEGCILINASRGEVVDNKALLSILDKGKSLRVVLDVWEPEPDLSIELLNKVDIGTPHIAGYTLEGKARGTTQVFEAYCGFIGQPQQVELSTLLPAPTISTISVQGELTQTLLKQLIHLVYDVRRDDASLRKVAGVKGEFDKLRKLYPVRREWSSLHVICDNQTTANTLNAIGFSATHK